MEQLKELVYILSLNKTKKIRQYGFLQDETGRLLAFYNALVKEEFNTDEEAAKALLNVSPKHKTYRRLKNKLKEELLNAFLFLDLEKGEYTDIQKAYYHSQTKFAQISILLAQSARKTSYALAKKLLVKTIEFDFTTLTLELCRYLKSLNASHFGDEKEHQHYELIIEKKSLILRREIEAEALYESIVRHYVKSKATQRHLFDLYKDDYEKIKKHLGSVDSYIFQAKGYLAGVALYMSINDFKTTAQICQEAILYFENRPYNHRPAKLGFLYQLVICSMQLGNFEEGKAAIQKCYGLVTKGKHDWFRTLENHFLLCLYTQEYAQAWELFQTAKKAKGFQHLLPIVRDRWILHEAYIQFLVEIEKAGEEIKPDKKFRIQKFLNEVPPTFTQDKRGMNIPILIVQILFLWNRKRFDNAIQRIEALSKYQLRHLKKGDDTYRTNCFIKMMETSVQQGFQPKTTKAAAQESFDEMMEQEIVFANQSAELEYVPYHHLWEMGMEVLENPTAVAIA